jgi:two-component system, NtrC family, response regulator PilR
VAHHERILVADDEPEILSEIAGYLRRRGKIVVDVPSFGGAVQAFNREPESIGLLITDVRMPDGNGLELARFVIKQSRGKCPCLLITGHFEEAGLGPDLQAAGVRVLGKPFAMSALYSLALTTLSRSGKGSE